MRLVTEAIESRLDQDALAAADQVEDAGRKQLRSIFATAGIGPNDEED